MQKENREYVPEGIRDLFVPYIIARKLQHYNSKEEELKKRSLFDVECIAFWNHYQELHMNHTYEEYGHHLKAPTYQQVIDWFKVNNGIQLFPDYTYYDGFHYGYKWVKYNGEYGEWWRDNDGEFPDGWDTSEDAINNAIEEALKLI